MGDGDSSVQYQKCTIVDDFMDDVNVPSSAHITETDIPEQRVYNVKPENIPSAEIFSEKNKELGSPSCDLNAVGPDDVQNSENCPAKSQIE